MSSSLRSRLSAMGNGASRPAAAPRAGLRVVCSAHPLPEALCGDLDAQALCRMGLEGAWPGIERVLFLDTETTGLAGGAGTLAFMVGVAYARDGGLISEQYTLGDYADEPELLARIAALMARFSLIVTFNGRAFDLPLLRSRFTMNRMDAQWTQCAQLDLLPPARRLWKKRLGTVRLSVLEERVLRCGRTDDLPGSEAPRRFFAFVKTGDWALLEQVERHNRQDVLSMAALLVNMIGAYAGPAPDARPEDLFSLGRVLLRRGERAEALRCFHMASLPRAVTTVNGLRGRRAAGEALFALGLLYKRLGEYERAARAFEQVIARGQMGARPMVEMAKHCEHRARDLEAAMGWTDCALALCADARETAALEQRRRRIQTKIDRYGGKQHGN